MQERLQRAAGILCPVSSLPSPYGIGTFGKAAYQFIDLLKEAGQRYWQVLPIGPTGYGDSPYQPYSAFAGNPYFIDPELLMEEGLLTEEEVKGYKWSDTDSYISYDRIYNCRFPALYLAYSRSNHKNTREYMEFVWENGDDWLYDFALYCACKKFYDQKSWLEWPDEVRFRDEEKMAELQVRLKDEIEFQIFLQYEFRKQWTNLKQYAHENDVRIIGDIPLYMALDSADVWANPHLFCLDEDRRPTRVAGCPPDAFSADGQLWGNPIYDWKVHEAEDFAWWKKRMRANAANYDVIRIDHFIGIVRYFNIPAGDTTARNGWFEWGPGKKLTDAIDSAIGNECRIVAEDLGIMIPQVKELLAETGYPGMKVLQFGFDGSRDNDHLPYNYNGNCLVYCGTHDNETLTGFVTGKNHVTDVKNMARYFDVSSLADETDGNETIREEAVRELREKVFRGMYASTAVLAILTVSDLLGLGNEARINTPSTSGDNWKWRIAPGQLSAETLEQYHLKELAELFGRLG